MTYVMSDIHGMLAKFVEMLDKIGGIGAGDRLYILGDMIDRGKDGILVLQTIMDNRRIIPIIGNHESFALPMLKAIKDGTPLCTVEKLPRYKIWAADGGDRTAKEFASLSKVWQKAVIDYIESFSIYEEIKVGGRDYHLSHTLPEFDPAPGWNVHDVSYLEFIWGETSYEKRYDPYVTFITGHTPTQLIDPEYKGRIWHGNGHIAVDCGAAFDGHLGCICLDTMEEFYV